MTTYASHNKVQLNLAIAMANIHINYSEVGLSKHGTNTNEKSKDHQSYYNSSSWGP